MSEHDCEGGIGEVRWVMVGNMLDSDCIPCPWCADRDRSGDPLYEARNIAGPPPWWNRVVLPADTDDCAPGLEMEPGKVCASFDCDYDDHHPMHRMLFLERSKVWACVDCGHVARPSPGDDITREAFDAMDGYRRSNDSSDGGTL